MVKKKVIGIDLGTTYSCVAHYHDGKIEIIENKNTGLRTTPSIVTFTDNERIIGKQSRMSENTVYEIKRLIGRKFHEETLQNDIKKWPFKVLEKNEKVVVQVEYKQTVHFFQPEQISAMILARMKEIASLHLASTITDAVITVPAYFNDAQRQATKYAAKIAGLNVLRIINEPTAAAIAYGFDKKITTKKNILIFDLGGGTFDVSIMSIENGQFKVLAIGGDTHLGGCDFDNRLVEYFTKNYESKHGKEISKNKKAIYRLRTHCELAKRALSEALQTTIEIDAFVDGEDFIETLSRSLFERLNEDLFALTIKILKQTLEDSKLERDDIDDVVLIGGSVRIPKIQSLIKCFFNGKQPFQNVNADEAVAYGAALQAAILTDSSNPEFKGLQIIDVTPLSLGVASQYGIGNRTLFMNKVIARNTSIPFTAMQRLTTVVDNQTSMILKIYEGERPLAGDNLLLDEFTLSGIEKAPVAVPSIEITFNINDDGILSVTAVDKKSKAKNGIQIKNSGHLTKDEINNMITLAKKFEKEDQKVLEKARARNKLEEHCNKMIMNQQADCNRYQLTLEWLKGDDLSAKDILNKLNAFEKLKI